MTGFVRCCVFLCAVAELLSGSTVYVSGETIGQGFTRVVGLSCFLTAVRL